MRVPPHFHLILELIIVYKGPSVFQRPVHCPDRRAFLRHFCQDKAVDRIEHGPSGASKRPLMVALNRIGSIRVIGFLGDISPYGLFDLVIPKNSTLLLNRHHDVRIS